MATSFGWPNWLHWSRNEGQELRPGHRRVLGVHAHRRSPADASAAPLPRTRLLTSVDRILVPRLRVHGDRHQPARRVGRLTHGSEPHPRRRSRPADRCTRRPHPAATPLARVGLGRVRHVGPSPVRRGQRPHQDELQKCSKGDRRLRRRCPVPSRCDPDGIEERAQGRGLLLRGCVACMDRLRRLSVDHGGNAGSDRNRPDRPARRGHWTVEAEGAAAFGPVQVGRCQPPRRRPVLPLRVA